MKKRKRFLAIVLSVSLFFIFMLVCMGCGEKTDSNANGKYDVTIKIKCDDGGEWIFPPDVDEIRIERDFDGEEHRYYIDAYQLSKHPQYGKKWFSPQGEGANVFQLSFAFRNENGQVTHPERVGSRGEYCLHIYASRTSTLWNERTALLYITVK